MLDFDMRTVVLFSIFVEFIAFTVIFSLWFQNRRRYPGLTHWMAAFSLQVIVMVLLGLRDFIPDFFSIVVANMVMIYTLALVHTGIRKFFDRPGTQLYNYAILAVIAGLLLYYTYAEPSYSIRTIIVSAGIILVAVQCSWVVSRVTLHGKPVSRMLFFSFVGFIVASTGRIVVAGIVGNATIDIYESNMPDSLMMVLLQMFFLILTYNLVLLVNHRLALDTQAQERARTEAQLFSHNVLVSAPNPVIVSNMDTSIRYVNPAFEELTGYTAEEVNGLYLPYPWWPKENIEEYKAHFQHWAGDSRDRLEHRFIRKDGRELWAIVSLRTVYRDGTAQYRLSNWVDISERKIAEDRIKELYEKEKAAHAELLEEAQARGLFMDILAHELRTPLTPMLSSAETLKTLLADDDTTRNRLADNLFRSAETMARRLEELLEVARHARGAFHLNLERIDLSPFLERVISRFQAMFEASGQQLVTEVDGVLPAALVDGSRLEQVITNLLSNASKYGPARGTVWLTARVDESALRVDVRDEGRTITREEQKNLFKPYHRVVQDRKVPGLGLGLAVCKQIVEAHGGSIWIQPPAETGNTFSFTIPLEPAMNKEGGTVPAR